MAPRIVTDAFYRVTPYRKIRAGFAGLESPSRPKKEAGNFSSSPCVLAISFREVLRLRVGAFDILGRICGPFSHLPTALAYQRKRTTMSPRSNLALRLTSRGTDRPKDGPSFTGHSFDNSPSQVPVYPRRGTF